MRNGIYPPELRSVNLDSDWLYRRLGARLAAGADAALHALFAECRDMAGVFGLAGRNALERFCGPQGIFSRTWTAGATGLGVMLMLLAFLLSYYFFS
jgi:multicomponent Na+:H+ antiporter subunit D